MSRWISATLVAAAVTVAPLSAAQAAWPERPIRIVVGFAAGGPADAMARVAARVLGEAFPQQVVVENKAGAGGALAATQVMTAPPDGHTLLLTAFADILNPLLNPATRYELSRDFVPITRITGVGNVLVVHPSLPVRTVPEFLAHARANPGKLDYGSAGIGSASHLAGELLSGLTGVAMTHIPYKGTAQAQIDLQQGVLPFMFDSLISALPNVKADRVRALAVTTATRSPGAPDLPTLAEAGVDRYDLTSWFGLAAPAGTPTEVVDRIADAMREGLKSEASRAALLRIGGTPDDWSPAEFGRYIAAESARWKDLFDRKVVRIAR